MFLHFINIPFGEFSSALARTGFYKYGESKYASGDKDGGDDEYRSADGGAFFGITVRNLCFFSISRLSVNIVGAVYAVGTVGGGSTGSAATVSCTPEIICFSVCTGLWSFLIQHLYFYRSNKLSFCYVVF